jgi:hypothetical protein
LTAAAAAGGYDEYESTYRVLRLIFDRVGPSSAGGTVDRIILVSEGRASKSDWTILQQHTSLSLVVPLMANPGSRIYFEQLHHLHPVRLGLTFTQEWMDLNGGLDTVNGVLVAIRGMVCLDVWLLSIQVLFLSFFFFSGY